MAKEEKKQDGVIEYYPNAKMTCACGHTFEVGSTKKELAIDVCSNCHPFYTGTEKYIDTAGRVDRFKERMSKMESLKKDRTKTKQETSEQKAKVKEEEK